MGFKMKGPTFYKNTPLKQATDDTFADGTKKSDRDKETDKETKEEIRKEKKGKNNKKTLEDYLNEGFSQVEAEQMYLTQATTGRVD